MPHRDLGGSERRAGPPQYPSLGYLRPHLKEAGRKRMRKGEKKKEEGREGRKEKMLDLKAEVQPTAGSQLWCTPILSR